MTEAIILGLVWLDKWGPTIWWEGGYQKLWIRIGPQLPDQEPKKGGGEGSREARASQESTRGETSFLAVYADLTDVFSEQECDVLPPHWPTDYAINIVPGAKLPKPQMYTMTAREMEELCWYIDQNLARGFIQPARSRITIPVLFKEKKNGSLHLCVNFCSINGVCMENIYPPPPLMKDLLAHLAKGVHQAGFTGGILQGSNQARG